MLDRRVARWQHALQHSVDRVSGGVVSTKCGNVIVRPRYTDLAGPRCVLCEERM